MALQPTMSAIHCSIRSGTAITMRGGARTMRKFPITTKLMKRKLLPQK